MLAAYSASKSAVWSFTKLSAAGLREQNTAVVGMHVSFMDTDMTKGLDIAKISPQEVADATFAGLEANQDEVLVDDFTRQVKRSLSAECPLYLNPPEIA